MNPVINLSCEEKLLYNGLLFCELRMHKSIDDKLANIEMYLTKGANVNASDANDCNNKPLHIAVKKDETEIVQFLLQKGGNCFAKNKNEQTPLDLAKISQNKNKHEVIKIIETSLKIIDSGQIKQSKKEFQDIPSKVHKEVLLDKEEEALTNDSPPGIAGISGQLYETKLLALLLHRALSDHDIDHFYLGSNIAGLGALDDIVFKYYLKNESSPKIFFAQAKHRDNPTKDKLTVDGVIKPNNDFSLVKYFNSYMHVRKKFNIKSRNVMFEGTFQDLDCSFIIYTSAVERFHKKKLIEIKGTTEKLLSTSDEGKTFMYDYDDGDLEVLLKGTSRSTTISLAKAFAKNIATQIQKHKLKNMMFEELVKVYYVFLALNIVQTSNGESEHYVMGRFRKTFLESTEELMVLMKDTMFKEFERLSMKFNEDTLEFKLPKCFGKLAVTPDDEESLCKIFQKLMKVGEKSEKIISIVVDDDMVGPHKLFKKRDMIMIGNLVGETLILADESGLLKFNTEESSSIKTKTLFKILTLNVVTESDLNRCRYDITVRNFPQLSLCSGKYQKKNVVDFLNKLQFYTNQAREEEVENILKNEIKNFYNNEYKNSDAFLHIKSDAIYLQYHDRIQKWWKHRTKQKKYRTKNCTFYEDAKQNILNSPLVHIYSFIYVTKINKFQLNFDKKAVEVLGLQTFMDSSDNKVLCIITADKILTSIKVKQYFKNNILNHQKTNYKFIDFNALAGESNGEIIISEIAEAMMDVIIYVLSNVSNITDFQKKLFEIQFVKKVIIITHSNSLAEILKINFNCFEQIDQNNSLCDLDTKTKIMVVDQKKILFQGSEVPFISIIDENMYNLVKGEVLHKILKNDWIKIGNVPTNFKTYNEIKDFYVNRRICRCLKLSGKQYRSYFNVIHDSGEAATEHNNRKLLPHKDILLISNDNNAFEKICEKHCNENIHWFRRTGGNVMWEKSYGSLKKIITWVERIRCNENGICSLEPQSLKDLNDRVVVVSAGPGMGKSTLLTHLMMQTKHNHKSMCVIKINLINLTNEFRAWQKCDVDIKFRLGWFLLVLYREFSIYKTGFLNTGDLNNEKMDIFLADDITFVDFSNRIYLNHKEARITSKIHELHLFEFKAFIKLYNDNKMALILDGFDEICPDFKKEAIEFFNLLISSRVKHLWITSRSYMIINELECELNTFSFTLKGFSTNEQIGFLEKFWGKNIPQQYFSSFIQMKRLETLRVINIYVTQFFNAVSYKIKDHQKDFTGTPLHLHMIAVTFQEYFINYYFSDNNYTPKSKDNDPFNLITLYENFINIKFLDICFDEKTEGLNRKYPYIKMVIDRERKIFIENHKKLAAYSLLHKKSKSHPTSAVRKQCTGILTESDFKLINDLIQQINLGEEKTGIVEMIIQNEPKFVHFTYAEYFACEFMCDKLKQNLFIESTWKYFINHVLVMDNGGIRGFIDAKLEKDQVLSNFTSKCISDALLRQRNSNKSALYLAVIEERDNIASFLLNNLKTFLDTNSLDDFIALVTKKNRLCTSCSAQHQRNPRVMTQIIEIINQLDCFKLVKLLFCKDIPKCNIFMITFLHHDTDFHRSNMDIILEHTDPKDLTKLLLIPLAQVVGTFNQDCYKYPILHILLPYTTKVHIFKYLEKLNQEQCMAVFCARDDMRRVPAHWAALYDNFYFFDIMAGIVGKKQFKKICTLTDKFGQIPLRCFGSIPFTLDKYKPICAKAGIDIGFREKGRGWYLYDIENPDSIW